MKSRPVVREIMALSSMRIRGLVVKNEILVGLAEKWKVIGVSELLPLTDREQNAIVGPRVDDKDIVDAERDVFVAVVS